MSTFWNDPTLEPRRNFRFKLLSDSKQWWWVKTVDKPSFEVSSGEYQLINHKFKYPGIVTWKPITITIADLGDTLEPLVQELISMGYDYPDNKSLGLQKNYAGNKITNMQIQQLDSQGTSKETWTISGAFITSLSMSKLDYSNDDIVEITIEVAYDFAKLT